MNREAEEWNVKIDELMQKVSEIIKKAQTGMRDKRLFLPAQFRDIEWRQFKTGFKITTLDGVPLEEVSFETRAGLIHQIPGLIDAAFHVKSAKITPLVNETKLLELSKFLDDFQACRDKPTL